MKNALITLNVFLLIIIIPSIIGAMMSPRMFDMPGAEKSKNVWMLVCALVVLPFFIIISQIISWIAFNNQYYDLALTINTFPVFNIFMVVYLFIMVERVRMNEYV
jgi:hypothetical protein